MLNQFNLLINLIYCFINQKYHFLLDARHLDKSVKNLYIDLYDWWNIIICILFHQTQVKNIVNRLFFFIEFYIYFTSQCKTFLGILSIINQKLSKIQLSFNSKQSSFDTTLKHPPITFSLTKKNNHQPI